MYVCGHGVCVCNVTPAFYEVVRVYACVCNVCMYACMYACRYACMMYVCVQMLIMYL